MLYIFVANWREHTHVSSFSVEQNKWVHYNRLSFGNRFSAWQMISESIYQKLLLKFLRPCENKNSLKSIF